MTMKELTQVSVINALLVAQVPSLDDAACVDEFMEQLQENLHQKNLHSLQYVCQGLDCTPTKPTRLYKADYTKALVHWVSSFPFPYLSYRLTENISSDVRSPYQPLHQMFAMSWTQAWYPQRSERSSVISQNPPGLDLFPVTLVMHRQGQSKQTSGGH